MIQGYTNNCTITIYYIIYTILYVLYNIYYIVYTILYILYLISNIIIYTISLYICIYVLYIFYFLYFTYIYIHILLLLLLVFCFFFIIIHIPYYSIISMVNHVLHAILCLAMGESFFWRCWPGGSSRKLGEQGRPDAGPKIDRIYGSFFPKKR